MKCKVCGEPLSQQHEAHERWRLYRKGFTRKQVLAVAPRCHLCLNQWLNEHYRVYAEVNYEQPNHQL